MNDGTDARKTWVQNRIINHSTINYNYNISPLHHIHITIHSIHNIIDNRHMLTTREKYFEWAKATINLCKEKHSEISVLLHVDENPPSADEVNNRVAEGKMISDICMSKDITPPILRIKATEEEKRDFLLNMKIYTVQNDMVTKYKSLTTSCIAFIKSRISESMLQVIYSNNHVKEAENAFDLYRWWIQIRDTIYPRGISKKMSAALLASDIISMRQASEEDIVHYANNYTRKREEYFGLGYKFYADAELEGILFLQSLNENYLELKNAVQNGIIEATSFIDMREKVIKWNTSSSKPFTSQNEVAMMTSEAMGTTARYQKKKKLCFACNGPHLLSSCIHFKNFKTALEAKKNTTV